MGNRVAIYARQSVAEEDGIDQQIEEVGAELKRRKWRAVDVYPDNNVSATKERKIGSEWARMLRDIDSGRIDTVVVTAVDRLMRRLTDLLEVTKPKRDVRIVIVRGGIDTDDPSGVGVFMLGQFVLLAEQEVRTKSRRVLPYRDARLAQGIPTPGRVQFGYRWIGLAERRTRGSERRWEVEEEEAAIVRRIFAEAADKVNLGAICRGLNDDNLRTRPSKRSPLGAPWRSTTVRRILLSPFYAGLLPPLTKRSSGKTYLAENVDLEKCKPGDWEPLVTVDQLRVVRRRLTAPDRRTNGGIVTRRWLLSGLARCGAVTGEREGVDVICGAFVRSAWTREAYHPPLNDAGWKKEDYRAYRCPAGHFTRRAPAIDAWAIQTLLERLSSPDAASLIQPDTGVDLAALHLRQDALQARRNEVLAMVAAGHYKMPEAVPYLDPIDAELDQLGAAIADAEKSDPIAEMLSSEDIRETWDRLSLARKRLLLAAVFEPIVFPVGKGRQVTSANVASTVHAAWRRQVAVDGRWEPALSEDARRALASL